MITTRVALAVAAAMFISAGIAFAETHAKTKDSDAQSPGSSVIGSVESDVTIRRNTVQQSGQENKQSQDLGSVVGSAVIGDVQSTVKAEDISQSQRGNNNDQKLMMGTVHGSAVIGTVNSKVDAKDVTLDQEGENNSQTVTAGTIR